MKDLDQLHCAMIYSHTDKKGIRYAKLGFYDPENGDTIKDHYQNTREIYLVSAKRFLEYTNGDPEENAKIREKFPNLISVLEGNSFTVPLVKAYFDEDGFYDLRRTMVFNDSKDVIVAGHDAWSMGECSPSYKIKVTSFQLGNYTYNSQGHRWICDLRNLEFKLENPEIPKVGTRIFNVPLRFDELSSFRDAKKLLLSLTYWPKEIALFSAVTRYYGEEPFTSTIVYHPSYHTMKDVFLRLFSHKKKGFTTSLYDICKVLDIMEKHDSDTQSEDTFNGGKYIGGLDKASVKAYLGLRTFVRAKKIEQFREVVDGELDTARKFVGKLERLREECEKIYQQDPESSLSDLSRKLISDLYEEVIVDPTAFTGLRINETQYNSRNLIITKVLTDLCLTSPTEDNLIKETTDGTADPAENESNDITSSDA